MNNTIRKELYWKYLQELEKIDGVKWEESDDEKRTWCNDYLTCEHYEWIDVRYLDQIIGFLIIGTEPDCHPDCDYFICQSYILPEFRMRGLMTKTVTQYVNAHIGKYCMIILKNNHSAKKYWKNLFYDNSYKQMQLSYFPLRNREEQYGFEPKVIE